MELKGFCSILKSLVWFLDKEAGSKAVKQAVKQESRQAAHENQEDLLTESLIKIIIITRMGWCPRTG